MNISFRHATPQDAMIIAQIHATSWQIHYRGLCTDDYLDNQVLDDRIKVWKERFATANERQHVLLAHTDKGHICGFVCTYLQDHEVHGAYLDNLHVLSEYQRLGIGKLLMSEAARWVRLKDPSSSLYLHVLSKNTKAIKFYEKIGGKNIGTYDTQLPWGPIGSVTDYLWTLDQLV